MLKQEWFHRTHNFDVKDTLSEVDEACTTIFYKLTIVDNQIVNV